MWTGNFFANWVFSKIECSAIHVVCVGVEPTATANCRAWADHWLSKLMRISYRYIQISHNTHTGHCTLLNLQVHTDTCIKTHLNLVTFWLEAWTRWWNSSRWFTPSRKMLSLKKGSVRLFSTCSVTFIGEPHTPHSHSLPSSPGVDGSVVVRFDDLVFVGFVGLNGFGDVSSICFSPQKLKGKREAV